MGEARGHAGASARPRQARIGVRVSLGARRLDEPAAIHPRPDVRRRLPKTARTARCGPMAAAAIGGGLSRCWPRLVWPMVALAVDSPLDQSARARAIPDGHRFRGHRAGGGGVARWTIGRVHVGSRRPDGCVGHPGRHRPIPQSDAWPRAAAGESVGAHARLLPRRRLCDVLGARRRGRQRRTRSASGRFRLWAASPSRTSKASRSSNGRATAIASTYHTPGPGDPMFVERLTAANTAERQIFAAAAGLHAHFPSWSPDGALHLFVQGSVPDAMDIWRMTPDREGRRADHPSQHRRQPSGPVERHDLDVSREHWRRQRPAAPLDGPSRSRSHVSSGTSLDRYTSLAVSMDGRRIVATRANPKGTLGGCRSPMRGGADQRPPGVVSLPTGRGFAARLGAGYLLYVCAEGAPATRSGSLPMAVPVELWSAPGARIIGGPELSPDGRRVAFSVGGAARRRSM